MQQASTNQSALTHELCAKARARSRASDPLAGPRAPIHAAHPATIRRIPIAQQELGTQKPARTSAPSPSASAQTSPRRDSSAPDHWRTSQLQSTGESPVPHGLLPQTKGEMYQPRFPTVKCAAAVSTAITLHRRLSAYPTTNVEPASFRGNHSLEAFVTSSEVALSRTLYQRPQCITVLVHAVGCGRPSNSLHGARS